MVRFTFLFMIVFCFSCQVETQPETIVAEEKAEKHQEIEKIEFKKITLTMVCFCPGWNTKDVEVYKDGTIYYRLRDYEKVGKNYKGQLDSVAMAQVYSDNRSFSTENEVRSSPPAPPHEFRREHYKAQIDSL